MRVSFIAGFGPIVGDMDASYQFWHDRIGIAFDGDPGYGHTDAVDGARAFALWRLSQAAESTFGTDAWPADLPAPHAWIESA